MPGIGNVVKGVIARMRSEKGRRDETNTNERTHVEEHQARRVVSAWLGGYPRTCMAMMMTMINDQGSRRTDRKVERQKEGKRTILLNPSRFPRLYRLVRTLPNSRRHRDLALQTRSSSSAASGPSSCSGSSSSLYYSAPASARAAVRNTSASCRPLDRARERAWRRI